MWNVSQAERAMSTLSYRDHTATLLPEPRSARSTPMRVGTLDSRVAHQAPNATLNSNYRQLVAIATSCL